MVKKIKSYIYKTLSAVALTFSLGMATSCVGDLNQEPKDPNVTTSATFGEEEVRQALAKCYSVLGVSGQSGPGSSDISGLDNGTGQYIRALAMMNEYTTDELMWIYADDGVVAANAAQLAATGVDALHFSAKKMVIGGMEYRNPRISMGGSSAVNEYALRIVDEEEVKEILKLVK